MLRWDITLITWHIMIWSRFYIFVLFWHKLYFLLTLGMEYPINSVSLVVQWKTLRGTVSAILWISWMTACMMETAVRASHCTAFQNLKCQTQNRCRYWCAYDPVTLIPAHNASGVCLHNWLDPSQQELCLFPADSALTETDSMDRGRQRVRQSTARENNARFFSVRVLHGRCNVYCCSPS